MRALRASIVYSSLFAAVHEVDSAGSEVCSSGAQHGEAIIDVSRRFIPVFFLSFLTLIYIGARGGKEYSAIAITRKHAVSINPSIQNPLV